MIVWKLLAYYRDFFKLVVQTGLIWRIKESSVPAWRERVMNSPRRYELEALEKRRIELTGRGFHV